MHLLLFLVNNEKISTSVAVSEDIVPNDFKVGVPAGIYCIFPPI